MPVGERGLLKYQELWPQEQQLCEKAVEGGLLDLRCRESGQDNPVQGQGWGEPRRVRAQVLYQLLTGQGPQLAETVLAVRLRGAQIVGRLNLGGQSLRCPLELNQCHLRHRLDLAKADAPNLSLRGSYLRSRLSARQLQVTHTLNLSESSYTRGVRLFGAQIKGQLDCEGAVFASPKGVALGGNGLAVGGNMSLAKANCTGVVRLFGAQIKGQLDCEGAVFANPGAVALSGEALTVGTALFLNEAQCTGEVRLLGAQIKGVLACEGTVFANPNGDALSGDGLSVDGDLFLRQAQCTGEMMLFGAQIKGVLACNGAVFTNPGAVALAGKGLSVGGDLLLDRAQCTGEVQLDSAQIKGDLNCTETVFDNPDGVAVDLESATVSQAVFMLPASFTGGLDLMYAQVRVWSDNRRSWPTLQSPPKALWLDGFEYETIGGKDVTVEDRLRYWLPRRRYLPQPYQQLAAAYRRKGHEQDARTVAIGKQRARRADFSRWWVRWPSVAWSILLRWTIGYGYKPALILIPLAVLIISGWKLFDIAYRASPSLLRPARTSADIVQPAFHSFRYTMDLLLPVVTFKQRDSFVAEGWAAWAAFGFTFAGWLLAAIVVAGLSGVFKRD